MVTVVAAVVLVVVAAAVENAVDAVLLTVVGDAVVTGLYDGSYPSVGVIRSPNGHYTGMPTLY